MHGGDVLRPYQCAHDALIGIAQRLADDLQRLACLRARVGGIDHRARAAHRNTGRRCQSRIGGHADDFHTAHVGDAHLPAQVSRQFLEMRLHILADSNRTMIEADHLHQVVARWRGLNQALDFLVHRVGALNPAHLGQRLRVQ
ncbi:hypothetical protein SDC9_157825 [bioreactor metagenome]|uniref:Uncharacterized protein n=1 Tax=bioreactor metagenome TaxID=1076179 RepID=A0A645F9E7_9ZZZZ